MAFDGRVGDRVRDRRRLPGRGRPRGRRDAAPTDRRPHAVIWNGVLIPLIGFALVLAGPLVLLPLRASSTTCSTASRSAAPARSSSPAQSCSRTPRRSWPRGSSRRGSSRPGSCACSRSGSPFLSWRQAPSARRAAPSGCATGLRGATATGWARSGIPPSPCRWLRGCSSAPRCSSSTWAAGRRSFALLALDVAALVVAAAAHPSRPRRGGNRDRGRPAGALRELRPRDAPAHVLRALRHRAPRAAEGR